MKIQRYDICAWDYHETIEEIVDDGEWCKFEDVEKLLKYIDALEERINNLEILLYNERE